MSKRSTANIIKPDTPYVAIASPILIVQEVTLQGQVLAPRERRVIIDNEERGYFHACGIYAANPDVILDCEITLYDGSVYKPWSSHNSFRNLLSLGFGLSPGDVAPIAGISPDPAGKPNHAHPFVTRYKTTGEVDVTGDSGQIYGMAYLPNPPVEYSGRLKVVIRNPTDSSVTLHHFYVFRRVFKE